MIKKFNDLKKICKNKRKKFFPTESEKKQTLKRVRKQKSSNNPIKDCID
jgi:hypothetical protein